MYKPSIDLEVAYFPTYLPIYETYCLQDWLPRWNQMLTQLRYIHNWVITDGVLAHCGPFYALLLASKTSCDYKEFAFSMTFMGQQFEITIVLLLSKSA